jgi:hypothetical protein
MTQVHEVKKGARILEAYREQLGISLAHSHALEAMTRIAQYRNWATLFAASETNARHRQSPELASIANWPRYVFALDEDEDTLADRHYFHFSWTEWDQQFEERKEVQRATTLAEDASEAPENLCSACHPRLDPTITTTGRTEIVTNVHLTHK